MPSPGVRPAGPPASGTGADATLRQDVEKFAHLIFASPTFRRSRTQFGVNFWLPRRPKCVLWDAKQREDLALELGELDVEDLHDLAVVHELVPLGESEQTQDLFRGRARAVALLGIERQFGNVLALHGKA